MDEMLKNVSTVSPANQSGVAGQKQGTVLIVDDEEGPRQSLRLVLKEHYNVFLADNGESALEIARTNRLDVAILDIRMCAMSGIAVLMHLKQHDPDIQVIMCTAYETLETARHALRLGACDYLNKPFDILTIRRAVADAMQSRRVLTYVRTQGGVDRSVLDHHLAELTRLRCAEINQDWRVAKLEREIAVLRSDYEGLSQKYKSLTAQNGRNSEAGITAISSVPPNSAIEGENHAIEVPVDMLTNTTAAFIHKLNNQYTTLEGLIEDLKLQIEQIAVETGDELRKKAESVTAELHATRYLFQRFRNTMGRHPGKLRPTGINAILSDVVQHLKNRFDQPQRIAMSIAPDNCKVLGDNELLWHLFENVIRNGLDAVEGRPDAKVSVDVSLNQRRDQVTIEVQDNGEGIPQEKLDQIFRMNYTTKPKGLGIGLYLAQRAAQIHRGTLQCKSEPGKGTTFRISLPALPGTPN